MTDNFFIHRKCIYFYLVYFNEYFDNIFYVLICKVLREEIALQFFSKINLILNQKTAEMSLMTLSISKNSNNAQNIVQGCLMFLILELRKKSKEKMSS